LNEVDSALPNRPLIADSPVAAAATIVEGIEPRLLA
jgi:hypothetical protein